MSDVLPVKQILRKMARHIPDDPAFDKLRKLVDGALEGYDQFEVNINAKQLNREIEDIKEINTRFLEFRKIKTMELDYKDILNNMLNEQFSELNEMNRIVSDEIETLRTRKRELDIELDTELNLLNQARREHEKVMKERRDYNEPIEGKVKGLKASIFDRELKYRIILQLLRDGYLKDPTFDLIQTIKRHPEIDTIDRLAQVSNVNKNSIRNIFRSLQNMRIMSWDMNKETFHLVVDTEV